MFVAMMKCISRRTQLIIQSTIQQRFLPQSFSLSSCAAEFCPVPEMMGFFPPNDFVPPIRRWYDRLWYDPCRSTPEIDTSVIDFILHSYYSPHVTVEFVRWISPYIPRDSKRFTLAVLGNCIRIGALPGAPGGARIPISHDAAVADKLRTYLEGSRVGDAYELFCRARRREADAAFFSNQFTRQALEIKFYHSWLAVSCSNVTTPRQRLQVMNEMEEIGVSESLSRSELYIHFYCINRQYDDAVAQFFLQRETKVSTFIGNLFLLHSFKSRGAFLKAWSRDIHLHSSTGLGGLIAVFSGRGLPCNPQELEEEIERCFPPDVFTYNLLLKKVGTISTADSIAKSETIIWLMNRMMEKGFVNSKSFDLFVHILSKLDGFYSLDSYLELLRRWVLIIL